MGTAEAVTLFHSGIKAWQQDLSVRTSAALPQTEIIPLVCLWKQVMTREQSDHTTAWDFSNDVLADTLAVKVLGTRVLHADSNFWRMADELRLPLRRFEVLRGPEAHMWLALNQGRPTTETHASPKEIAIARLLGGAAYDSADGMPVFSLNPLGPAPSNPEGWKILGFTQTEAFVESIV